MEVDDQQSSPEVHAAWDKASETTGQWSAERREAWFVAAYARRFELLARRDAEFGNRSREQRTRFALTHDAPGGLHLFDAAQVVGASELDILCGRAVSVLSSASLEGRTAVLDLLGCLDPTRVAAIYYALSEEARRAAEDAFAFQYHAKKVARFMPQAEADLAELIAATPTSDVGHGLARESEGLGMRLPSPERLRPTRAHGASARRTRLRSERPDREAQ